MEEQYLKFIAYVPHFWHIEEIKAKKISKLTSEELNYLCTYLRDLKLLNYLKNNPDSKESYQIKNFLTIDNLAINKLSKTELQSVYDTMALFKNQDYSSLNKQYESLLAKENRNIAEEYILYKLSLLLPGIKRSR